MNFMHYDTMEKEPLCWGCREPIIMDRIHGEKEEDETWTPEREQGDITDFF